MKKKLLVAVSMATLVMSLVGCGLSGGEVSGKNDKDAELEIEMSASKVLVEVGEEAEVEIENFDDLKKVEIEVDDEDIAKAELDDDDGTITVEGVEEGKTKIIIIAKGCDEVVVTVKVTESANKEDSDTGSGEDIYGSGNESGGGVEHYGGEDTFVGSKMLYSHYQADIPYDVWGTLLDMDDTDETTTAILEIFKKCEMDFHAEMNLDLTNATYGTGEFVFDVNDLMNQFCEAMRDEDLFIEYMEVIYGESFDAETREAMLDMQDDFIEMMITDEEPIVSEFDWEYDKDSKNLTITEDSRSGVYTVNKDGSFDYYASDSSVWLTFVPVK